MPSGTGRAVVVGASVAGLSAAAALAPHYREVLVLDRDRLPAEPVPRSGVPQARHAHVLLEPGCAALEELLPGVVAQLVAAGAVLGDLRRWIAPATVASGAGGRALAGDREILESWLRSRVGRLPAVQVRGRTAVLDLVVSAARAAGVVVADLDHPDRPPESLTADLVVDASGRGSRLVECLVNHGCAVPRVERVRIDARYVTRRFALPAGATSPGPLDSRDGVVSCGVGRSAVLVRVAEREWLLTLAGYGGTRPPPDLTEFIAYAHDAGEPVADLVAGLEPSGAPLGYREPALIRRRLDLVDTLGVLVVGDALCTVDAAAVAGMSAAAIEASALGGVLRDGAADVPRFYYRRTRGLVDQLWEDALCRRGLVVPLPNAQ